MADKASSILNARLREIVEHQRRQMRELPFARFNPRSLTDTALERRGYVRRVIHDVPVSGGAYVRHILAEPTPVGIAMANWTRV